MSTLKAFGISCGIVLGMGVGVTIFALACIRKPWLFFVLLAVSMVILCTLVLRRD